MDIRFRLRTLIAFLSMLVLAACGDETGPRSIVIEDKQDFIEALRGAGADVSETAVAGEVELGLPAEVLQINSATIYVYAYESVAARRAVSDDLSGDGANLDGRPLAWPERANIWATGRLIVAYAGTDGGTIMLLNGLLGDPITQAPAPVDEPFPPAVTAAVGFLAEKLDLNPEDIEVTDFAPETWPDACLGLPEEGEVCAQVATPGWRIQMRIGSEEFVLHSDQVGEHLRMK